VTEFSSAFFHGYYFSEQQFYTSNGHCTVNALTENKAVKQILFIHLNQLQ